MGVARKPGARAAWRRRGAILPTPSFYKKKRDDFRASAAPLAKHSVILVKVFGFTAYTAERACTQTHNRARAVRTHRVRRNIVDHASTTRGEAIMRLPIERRRLRTRAGGSVSPQPTPACSNPSQCLAENVLGRVLLEGEGAR
jgi:hypothetical protein